MKCSFTQKKKTTFLSLKNCKTKRSRGAFRGATELLSKPKQFDKIKIIKCTHVPKPVGFVKRKSFSKSLSLAQQMVY